MNFSIVKIKLTDRVEWWVIVTPINTPMYLNEYYKRNGKDMPPLDPSTFVVAVCGSREMARDLLEILAWRSKFVGKPINQWLKSEERIRKRNNAMLRGLYVGDES